MHHHSTGILAAAAIALLAAAPAARAQAPAPVPAGSDRPFEISDNSFFVEEALNQEPGVVQTIVGAALLQDAGWSASVTQEWPVPGMRHQLSFTLPVASVDGQRGVGDLYLHGNAGVTWYPRVTPVGRADRGHRRGEGHVAHEPVRRRERDLPAAPDVPPDAGVGADLAAGVQ